MLRLLRSGSDGPTAACEEDQRYLVSSPVMGGVFHSLVCTPMVKRC